MKKAIAFGLTAVMAASLAAPVMADSSVAEAASGDLITVGFSQVGHESDWRTASTNSVKEAFSKDKGFDLQFVDCDNDSQKQI